ncbi:hypothetical protein HAP47_0003105 [Bradyrhizobium sp. 41S5]|uniref:hypothetical protein n=1 Tax=Bradyrhizobium sp. 41S5 TaxID=1404443 RepID=UPI00156ABB7E|nr:hypothetical protein [Bradyrhizobium sp. 41S5]UFX45725.1 hypothetical protein HAP47_0003105 [Bradyrhizobium sp. 41S5]
MFLYLPIVMLAALPPTTVAGVIPKFDIARECRSEGGPNVSLERCARDEEQARSQLQSQWTQFVTADRRTCARATTADGSGSYVELLICLELARDAKASR